MKNLFNINFVKLAFLVLILHYLFFKSTVVHAQDCSSLSGIVNTYARVTNISGSVVTIGATSGASTPFAAGDNVILIQMTGTPPAQSGSNMGKYELLNVVAVSGSSITLSTIANSYSFSTEKVQLVRVPNCSSGTVSATVTAKVWDGSTGGIVALKGSTLTLNADIDATGVGFSQANPPTTVTTSSLSSGFGTTSGRGVNAEGTAFWGTNKGGIGGGGIGGGGGAGGSGGATGGGGGVGGSGKAGISTYAGHSGIDGNGVGGGTGSKRYVSPATNDAGAGSGGGGGVIGGGGGGGGYSGTTVGGGGGGGVAGGGSGGSDTNASLIAGGGGGGTKGVGNGGNAKCTDGCAGAGGGSYGGGGGSSSAFAGGDDSAGGGGGGSWTGGGTAGIGGNPTNNTDGFPDGGAGNTAVATVITTAEHYLNTTQPRLMMGGAGGSGGPTLNILEGKGGGIILLNFETINGNNRSILSNGGGGSNAPTGYTDTREGRGGAGGGGGGQMLLRVNSFSNTTISAKGGKGGDAGRTGLSPNGSQTEHGGTSGAGGGGGGIWIYNTTLSSNTGGESVSINGTNLLGSGATLSGVAGGLAGANTVNPKNGLMTGTAAGGGNGLIMQSADLPIWTCTKPISGATPKTQSICINGTAAAYTATPSTGVGYRWYGPLTDTTSTLGTAISGATTASYTPTGTALSTGGTKYYAVVVTNIGDATCVDTAFAQLIVSSLTAPTLSGPSISNSCPATTVNLNDLVTSTAPAGTTLVWFTNTTHTGTAYSTPTTATAGTYYAYYFNGTDCYSPASGAVTVNITTCTTPCNPSCGSTAVQKN